MRYLKYAWLLLGLALVSAPRAHAASDAAGNALGVTARLGIVGIANAATTRSTAWELGVGGRWHLWRYGGVALGYRGAVLPAGTPQVGLFSSFHRLQLGPYVGYFGPAARASLAVGAQPYVQTAHVRGNGQAVEPILRYGIGGALEARFGLRVVRDVFASLYMTAMNRGRSVDLSAGLALDWGVGP